MSLSSYYAEYPSLAVASVRDRASELGIGINGIVGNDDHRYGYHLSPARLRGTGHSNDYSLQGALNHVVADRAACAVDVLMNWTASGEWLESVRRRCASGTTPQIAELIGDPDFKPGAGKDTFRAMYADHRNGWRWVEYTGEGHVAWCHLAVFRSFANSATLGDSVFRGWSRNGVILQPKPAAVNLLSAAIVGAVS